MIRFALLALVTTADAFVYTGNPNNDILCGFMAYDGGAQTHWDLDDEPQYQGPLDPFIEGNGTPTISYYCDRSWASIHYGSQDLQPGPGWKYRVFGYYDGTATGPDSAVCWGTYNGADWFEYDIVLY